MSSELFLPPLAEPPDEVGMASFISGAVLGLEGVPIEEPGDDGLLAARHVQQLHAQYRQVAWIVKCAVLVEYGTAALLFVTAFSGCIASAGLLEAVYLVVECAMEYSIYLKTGAAFKDRTLGTICMVPVESVGLPLWLFYLASLAPNYVQVLATATLAGVSFAEWTAASRGAFYEHWAFIPVIGPVIGSIGVPCLLTALVVVSSILHARLAWSNCEQMERRFGNLERGNPGHYEPCQPYYRRFVQAHLAEMCDAANLQFLGRAFRTLATAEHLSRAPYDEAEIWIEYWGCRQYSRLVASLFIKVPMLWLKISLLSLSYDTMTRRAFMSALSAIALSWYGLLQQLPPLWASVEQTCRVPRQYRDFETRSLPWFSAFLAVSLAFQALRFCGVFFCTSHDFSLYMHGCT